MIQQHQKPHKPIFSQPPDQSTSNINYIMSNLQKQQLSILGLLEKYKDILPDDPLNKQDERLVYTQRLNPIKNQKTEKKSKSKGKKAKKFLNMNIDQIRNIYRKQQMTNSHSQNKTVDYQKQSTENLGNKNRTISVKLQKNKTNVQNLNDVDNMFKLPSLNNKYSNWINKKNNQDKSVQEAQYEKTQKNYNENVIKFYQKIKNKPDIQPSEVQVIQEIHHPKKLRERQKNKLRLKSNKLQNDLKKKLAGQKFTNADSSRVDKQKYDNIFSLNEQQLQEQQLNYQHQIAKPISIRPYSDLGQIYGRKGQENSKKSDSRVENISKVSYNNKQEDEKPTEVAMSYYIRTFNQKLKQQCEQEINYLYFSKADQNDSNKQWAEEIIKIFNRHDQQLQRNHKNMKYLQVFDEGFFTTSIYQTGNNIFKS